MIRFSIFESSSPAAAARGESQTDALLPCQSARATHLSTKRLLNGTSRMKTTSMPALLSASTVDFKPSAHCFRCAGYSDGSTTSRYILVIENWEMMTIFGFIAMICLSASSLQSSHSV